MFGIELNNRAISSFHLPKSNLLRIYAELLLNRLGRYLNVQKITVPSMLCVSPVFFEVDVTPTTTYSNLKFTLPNLSARAFTRIHWSGDKFSSSPGSITEIHIFFYIQKILNPFKIASRKIRSIHITYL